MARLGPRFSFVSSLKQQHLFPSSHPISQQETEHTKQSCALRQQLPSVTKTITRSSTTTTRHDTAPQPAIDNEPDTTPHDTTSTGPSQPRLHSHPTQRTLETIRPGPKPTQTDRIPCPANPLDPIVDASSVTRSPSRVDSSGIPAGRSRVWSGWTTLHRTVLAY
jgi:hypothetical protein